MFLRTDTNTFSGNVYYTYTSQKILKSACHTTTTTTTTTTNTTCIFCYTVRASISGLKESM